VAAPAPGWNEHDDEDERTASARRLEAALASCYRHLGRRERSVAELRARLERERHRPEAVDEAVAIVAEQGYLDDARYASLLVEDRRTIAGWGVERIRARLEKAGIARELIDEALGGIDAAAELTAAQELIRRRCTLPLASNRERGRAFGILVGRGFDADVAYAAIRHAGGGDDG
jgi:regulatory protein